MAEDDGKVRFTLRMPAELHAAIQAIAKKNKRTVTKEIEFMLEDKVQSIAKEQKQ